jgi:hypothetical protein
MPKNSVEPPATDFASIGSIDLRLNGHIEREADVELSHDDSFRRTAEEASRVIAPAQRFIGQVSGL